MTSNPSPHTAGRAESRQRVLDMIDVPRGVKTNGIGQVTTAHLNLTVDMAGQVAAEVEERRRHVTNSHEQRSKSHG